MKKKKIQEILELCTKIDGDCKSLELNAKEEKKKRMRATLTFKKTCYAVGGGGLIGLLIGATLAVPFIGPPLFAAGLITAGGSGVAVGGAAVVLALTKSDLKGLKDFISAITNLACGANEIESYVIQLQSDGQLEIIIDNQFEDKLKKMIKFCDDMMKLGSS